MAHNEYWAKVKADAASRVCALLGDDAEEKLRKIVGDENGIDDMPDTVKVLAYILHHGDYKEVACAILSLGEWRQACHELAEHGQASV
jgi:hypothetical protein